MENLRHAFLKAINAADQQSVKAPFSQENSFNSLPKLLQQFFHRCGYTGFEKIKCVHIIWSDTMLRLSPKAKWNPMDCYQLNFLPEPVRLVYMKISIYGLIPLEALDYPTVCFA